MVDGLKTVVVFDPKNDKQFDSKLAAIGQLFEPDGRFAGFETTDALKGYMERNLDKEAQKEKGPYREMWVSLQDEQGRTVGAINQQIFIKPDGSATVQHSYVMAGEVKGADGQDIFTREQKAEITQKLYAAANVEAAQFVKDNRGNPARIATFAVETSALMVTAKDYAGDESKDTVKHRIVESQERLANAGFVRVDSRYLEASFENVDGAPTKHYDMFVKLPEGQKTLSVADFRQHLNSYLALSFPPGSHLSNEALKTMNDNLDRLERTGQNIPLAQPGDTKQLIATIDKNMPPITAENQDMPVGDLTPALRDITIKHYGAEGAKARGDSLPETAARVDDYKREATKLIDGAATGVKNGIVSQDEARVFAERAGKDVAAVSKAADSPEKAAAQERLKKLDLNKDGEFNAKDVDLLKSGVGGIVDKTYLNIITEALGGKSFPVSSVPVTDIGQFSPAQASGAQPATPAKGK